MNWTWMIPEKKFRLNANQTTTEYYDLTEDQMRLVGMRESKAVRKHWWMSFVRSYLQIYR
ncbi:hypothetical protein KAM339_023090 [Aeromonas caviae]|nr:hypothetical protein KAM339_023090 [Aeromonas caviae]